MPKTQRDYLIQEAKMQTKALQRIGVWRRAAWSVMVVGILLAYTGFLPEIHILKGIFGIVTAILGGSAALLIHIGYQNGKKNVEHILEAAQK